MSQISSVGSILRTFSFIWERWYKQKFPLIAFALLCANLLFAPAIYAAASGTLERQAAWAIGILLLLTVVLVGYLFIVVFQPERF
ncbi:potassium-transporting ATPase subunit F [Aliterella atlantica]|uniref:ATPase n=1 Tax=Aliterella atlantica CENA595 TaxID=1618023 RepID=A0A0D8ZWF1_9CYAN|nr:potassium-transporting ATPase subunit F [Aliterella atlantica]KJH72702.1 ATPase [Aliterella atlantica CENA595]